MTASPMPEDRLPTPVGQFGEDMGGAVQVERHDLAAGLRDLRLSGREVVAGGIGGTAGGSREEDSECGAATATAIRGRCAEELDRAERSGSWVTQSLREDVESMENLAAVLRGDALE